MDRANDQYASRGLSRAAERVLKWASVAAGVIALWLSYGVVGAPYITNDGYQYLDAARNLAAGECLCTRVALFDEQVEYGRMPVPFTHFGPGYPLAIAALARTGLSIEHAGYLVSAAGFLATVWLMWDAGLALGANAWMLGAFCLLWITQATAILYASMVGTESLFTALLIGTAALIVRDVRARSTGVLCPLAIGAVAGLSYWVRYPGLFVVGAAAIYLVARALRAPANKSLRWGTLAGLATAAALVLAIQIRNAVYTGSWRGGFKSAGGRHTPKTAILDTIRAFTHFVTGDRVPVRADFWSVLLLASFAAVLFFAFDARRRRTGPTAGFDRGHMWFLLVALVYIAGIFAATLITIAGDLARYYFPVWPMFLVSAAVGCSAILRGPRFAIARRLETLAVAALVISILAIEGRNLFARPSDPDWIRPAQFSPSRWLAARRRSTGCGVTCRRMERSSQWKGRPCTISPTVL